MIRKIIALLAVVISVSILSVSIYATAYAHSSGGSSVLDLPRCSPRSTSCQLPVDTATVPAEIAAHFCVDGLGTERSCDLAGPFDYLSLSTYIERDVPYLEPLSLTPCTDGFAERYPCSNVDLLSFMPLADIGGGLGSDLWGWTDSESGREYALMGRSNGVSFVDVSDPVAPIYLGNLPSYGNGISQWRDLKVYADHVFIVQDSIDKNNNHGLQIFDLRQLRNITNPPLLFETTAHYPLINRAHNIAINEETGYAYVVGSRGGDYTCKAGLHMVDISNPVDPQFAGCFSDDGYTHDTQCVIYRGPDIGYQDREICFSSNEDTLTIVDVTDKEFPQLLSIADYISEEADPDFKFYVHQGWLTEDQRYFFQDDEGDEAFNDNVNTRTYIWDVSNLRDPKWLGFHDLGTDSSDHNLYIQGSYIYEANYSSGLRILKTTPSAITALTEFGYFDTSPENSANGFADGAWTAYPYFDSGTVIVSGKSEGLFMLSPQEPPEFTLTPLDHHLLTCNASNAAELIGTTQLPPFADATATLQVAGYHGYVGDISISATSTSGSGTVLLDSSSVSLGNNQPGSIEVTVGVDDSWPTGTYEITLTGSDGSSEETGQITAQIANDKVAAVTGLVAADPTPDSPNVQLSWADSAGAALYMIDLSMDADFTTILESGQSVETQYAVRSDLKLDQSYHWRVRAINGCGETFSDVAAFQTDPGLYMPIIQIP